ncbi:hypothetical protein CCR75_003017 [Bremia lactucae]|uniref:Uncharacterized protein n=1 Tax=Bremia lactucae TaxID=4779 RepID=A0A976FF75_BRELC|nr:hypothetical protein CCR75_003017 [Bremia lactucae]
MSAMSAVRHDPGGASRRPFIESGIDPNIEITKGKVMAAAGKLWGSRSRNDGRALFETGA